MNTEDEDYVDSVLNEFGFTGKRGRGRKASSLVGEKNGSFICTRRGENRKSGQATWIFQCVKCGIEKRVGGSCYRSGHSSGRCGRCDGRYNLIKDVRSHMQLLLQALIKAADSEDYSAMRRCACNLANCSRRLEKEKISNADLPKPNR